MKKGFQEKYAAAYFTVEASLILPMVLLFTVMMIFLAFYSYDRCILEQSAYEAALRGTSSHFDSANEAYEEAAIAAGRLIEDKLFALHDLKYSVSVTSDSVIVSYSCEVNMPFISWLGEYINDLDFSINISREAKRSKQTKTIRGCRIANNLIEKGL